jgi:gamma-glutamyltranspeptidase / glutathione hydrolase
MLYLSSSIPRCLSGALLQWKGSEDLIRNASPDHEAMLLNGRAPLPGEVMRFPDLAKTFGLLADKGKDGFYTGPVAQAIVDLIKSKDGVMELEDLSRHTSTFVEPIHYTFQDQVTVYEASILQDCIDCVITG